jgi:hypothetical protein
VSADLAPYGFAEGEYMRGCRDCGQVFLGDKRARRCPPCAEKMWASKEEAAKRVVVKRARRLESRFEGEGW